MTSDKPPTIIKKYANRRLYNTGTSAYVTLEDLAGMVKHGEDFVVYDAKGGEDITRSVLAQIIFEQESKNGQSLLPITFLRQLIRFYGDSMQMLVPSYLELSMNKLTQEKGGFSDVFGQSALTSAMMSNPMAEAARPIFAQMEEQARQNVAMFRKALSMFTPASSGLGGAAAEPPAAAKPVPAGAEAGANAEYDEMRAQLDALQRRMESLDPKG